MNSSNKQLSLSQRILIMVALALVIQLPPVIELMIGSGLRNLNYHWMPWIVTFGVMAYTILFFVIILWAYQLFKRYRRWPVQTKNWGSQIGWILISYLVLLSGVGALSTLNQLLYHQATTSNNDTIQSLAQSSPVLLVITALSGIFLSPLAEELIFRGVLMNFFFKASSFWPPILLSGLIFTLEHSSTTIVSYLIYFFMGGVLAFVYRATGQLKISIGLHFLNNLIAMLELIIPILIK